MGSTGRSSVGVARCIQYFDCTFAHLCLYVLLYTAHIVFMHMMHMHPDLPVTHGIVRLLLSDWLIKP